MRPSKSTRSSGGMPCATRFGSRGLGPRVCCRIASGSKGLSLLQISTVGARFPGCSMHGIVTDAADRDRRILRQLAVQAVRGVDLCGVSGRAPGRRRQISHSAWRRIAHCHGEVTQWQARRVVRRALRLRGRNIRRKQDQQLLERWVVRHEDLADRASDWPATPEASASPGSGDAETSCAKPGPVSEERADLWIVSANLAASRPQGFVPTARIASVESAWESSSGTLSSMRVRALSPTPLMSPNDRRRASPSGIRCRIRRR